MSHIERQQNVCPSVIVIGGGISGIAAARILHDASFKVSGLQQLELSLCVYVCVYVNMFRALENYRKIVSCLISAMP